MYSVWCTLPQFFLYWAAFHDNRLSPGFYAFIAPHGVFVLKMPQIFAENLPIEHLWPICATPSVKLIF
jgi:hypothetical protein